MCPGPPLARFLDPRWGVGKLSVSAHPFYPQPYAKGGRCEVEMRADVSDSSVLAAPGNGAMECRGVVLVHEAPPAADKIR